MAFDLPIGCQLLHQKGLIEMSPALREAVKLAINFLLNLIPVVSLLTGLPGIGILAAWAVSYLAGWLTGLLDYAIRQKIIEGQVSDAKKTAAELAKVLSDKEATKEQRDAAFKAFKESRRKLSDRNIGVQS
jgi:hypothetical protein